MTDADYNSKNPDRIRKSIMEEICSLAEQLGEWSEEFRPFFEDRGIKNMGSFKPSLGDKLIFKKIINEKMAYIMNPVPEERLEDTNPKMIALRILIDYYYPEYGPYIEGEIKKGFEQSLI